MKTKYQKCKCKTVKDFDHYKHVWREDHENGLHIVAMWWCKDCSKHLSTVEKKKAVV